MIEVFGHYTKEKITFNIFTLIVFENTQQDDIKEFIFPKPQKFINIKGITWGIQRRVVDIDIVKNLYNDLLNKNSFEIDNILNIGTLIALPKQYVQSEDSFSQPQINSILKNNFHSGSYLLEFFDESKEYCQFLLENQEVLDSFSKTLTEKFPIVVGDISDRLGNIIFQFPINNLQIDFETIKEKNPDRYAGIKVQIDTKEDNYNINDLMIRTYEKNDNTITRQTFDEVKSDITTISLDDCFGTNIEIFDKNSSLLVYKTKFSILKEMNLNMQIMEHQKRVVTINSKDEKVSLLHNQNNTIHKQNRKEYYQWVSLRNKKRKENNTLSNHYHKEKQKALEDIREIINRYGQDEVYLLDPFLDNDDIKSTLCFSSNIYAKLKAVTSLEQRKLTTHNKFCIVCKKAIDSDKLTKQEMITDMKTRFQDDKHSFYNIDLEVRAVYKIDYDFHDRYLICKNADTTKVFSLGTSINSLGDKLHSIEEISNKEEIIKIAHNIWKKLDKEECIVWKSR